MLPLIRLNFQILCLFLAFISWAEGANPKYGPEAIPLSISYEYFHKTSAPQFWALIPYYIPQRDESACSLASVAMVANAARVGMPLKDTDLLVSQDDLRKKVVHPGWRSWFGLMGRGVTLDELGTLTMAGLRAYGIHPVSVDVIHTEDTSESTQKKLHETLEEFKKNKSIFLISNFIQGVYTGDEAIGHISPIGAYDSVKKRVLIMDPDRRWYEPYWVSEETFLKGMATLDNQSKKFRGYVKIKLP